MMFAKDEEVQKLRRWILSTNLQDALALLGSSMSNLESRFVFVQRDIEAAHEAFEKFNTAVNGVLADQTRAKRVDDDLELHEQARELYYYVLECISRLASLTEILLLYYGSLRLGAKQLSRVLTERWAIDFSKEEARIGRLRLNDVEKDFRFPEVSDYDCTYEEKSLLRRVLRRTAGSLRSNLRTLVAFRRSFAVVYNKYKHALVETVHMYSVVRSGGTTSCIPQVYVRSKEKSSRSGRNKVFTYVVRVDFALFDYLESVIASFSTVMVSLIDGHLQWLLNAGESPFPLKVDAREDELKEIAKIVDRQSGSRHRNFSGQIRLVWKPRAVARVERQLHNRHIARLDQDLMDPRKLRRFKASLAPSPT